MSIRQYLVKRDVGENVVAGEKELKNGKNNVAAKKRGVEDVIVVGDGGVEGDGEQVKAKKQKIELPAPTPEQPPVEGGDELKLPDGYKAWGQIAYLLTDTGVVTDGGSLCRFIRELNSPQSKGWDLSVLEMFCDTVLLREISENFFSKIFPWMAEQALAATKLPKPRLLKRKTTSRTSITELHMLGLMSHAFLCMVPGRYRYTVKRHEAKGASDWKSYSEFSKYREAVKSLSDVNFLPLYGEGLGRDRVPNQVEKLKCLFQYFSQSYMELCEVKRVVGTLTVVRTNIEKPYPWASSDAALCSLAVEPTQRIEDSLSSLQIDFANENLGGGVVGKGCVQEEIRFLISPGLFAARFLCERLADTDTVTVYGAKQFSAYTGYADTFRWAGGFRDTSEQVAVAMGDMLNYMKPQIGKDAQYRLGYMVRELHKMYVTMSPVSPQPFEHKNIASGKWGCGVFGGDVQFKLLLQLCAASATGCSSLTFHAFDDEAEAATVAAFRLSALSTPRTIGELFTSLRSFDPAAGLTAFQHVEAQLSKSTIVSKEVC